MNANSLPLPYTNNYNTDWKIILSEKVTSLFKVRGTPDSINDNYFLYYLLIGNGLAIFNDMEEKLRCFELYPTDLPSGYYTPEKAMEVNFRWGDYQLEKGVNSEFVYSNQFQEIFGINIIRSYIMKYGEMLNIIDKSLTTYIENTRCVGLISATNSATIKSAENAITALKNNSFAVMNETLIDNIKLNPINVRSNSEMLNLVNTRQYLLSEFYTMFGIPVNNNMKRERITEGENDFIEEQSQLNSEKIVSCINSHLFNVNYLFNTEIEVYKDED